jgi:hypothetical protein
MAIAAYGYGVNSTAQGGARLVDFATAISAIGEPVTVTIEPQYTVTVELPPTISVEATVPTVTVED